LAIFSRRLLFDRSLDSRQRRVATTYTEWADIGIVFQSKKYRPIPDPPQYRPVLEYPNASIIRTLVWNF